MAPLHVPLALRPPVDQRDPETAQHAGSGRRFWHDLLVEAAALRDFISSPEELGSIFKGAGYQALFNDEGHSREQDLERVRQAKYDVTSLPVPVADLEEMVSGSRSLGHRNEQLHEELIEPVLHAPGGDDDTLELVKDSLFLDRQQYRGYNGVLDCYLRGGVRDTRPCSVLQFEKPSVTAEKLVQGLERADPLLSNGLLLNVLESHENERFIFVVMEETRCTLDQLEQHGGFSAEMSRMRVLYDALRALEYVVARFQQVADPEDEASLTIIMDPAAIFVVEVNGVFLPRFLVQQVDPKLELLQNTIELARLMVRLLGQGPSPQIQFDVSTFNLSLLGLNHENLTTFKLLITQLLNLSTVHDVTELQNHLIFLESRSLRSLVLETSDLVNIDTRRAQIASHLEPRTTQERLAAHGPSGCWRNTFSELTLHTLTAGRRYDSTVQGLLKLQRDNTNHLTHREIPEVCPVDPIPHIRTDDNMQLFWNRRNPRFLPFLMNKVQCLRHYAKIKEFFLSPIPYPYLDQ